MDAELDSSSLRSVVAALVLVAIAVALAVLPAAIALRVVDPPAAWVGAGAALSVALGGVKLLAIAWGVRGRLWRTHLASVVAAYVA